LLHAVDDVANVVVAVVEAPIMAKVDVGCKISALGAPHYKDSKIVTIATISFKQDLCA
jgi:hypothetical protein